MNEGIKSFRIGERTKKKNNDQISDPKHLTLAMFLSNI